MAITEKNTMQSGKPVWFITGCSTGFGRQIATHVLQLGYRTVVTSRDPDDVSDLAERGDASGAQVGYGRQELQAEVKASKPQ